MVAFSVFSKSCQKRILFGQNFLTPETPGICFTNVHNIREIQRTSGKFRWRKRLFYDKQPAKNATLSFFVFPLFQLQNDLWQKIFLYKVFFKIIFGCVIIQNFFLQKWFYLFINQKLQRFLGNLKKKGFSSKEVYDKLYPCGSKPTRVYGNHKTHKLKCKTDKLTFRPTVFSVGTYSYKFSKFLTQLLNQLFQRNSYRFLLLLQRNTKGKFLQQIHGNLWCLNILMVIYDDNILLKETIELATSLIFEKHPEI